MTIVANILQEQEDSPGAVVDAVGVDAQQLLVAVVTF